MDRLEVIERSRREARRGLDDLAQALARAAFLPRQPVEPSLDGTLHHVTRVVSDKLLFRLGEGFGAPVIAVFAGGTGVGKSTLLNTVAGHRISPVSVKRPCTTSPLVFHHREYGQILRGDTFLPGYTKGDHPSMPVEAAAPAEGAGEGPSPGVSGSLLLGEDWADAGRGAPPGGKGGEGGAGPSPDGPPKEIVLIPHKEEALRNVILIDSPDFDSVSHRNQELSEDILRVGDLVLYVVNPEKYADDEVWKVIRKIAGAGRPVLFVFNRARGEDDEAVGHFRELLRPVNARAEVLTFPERRDAGPLGRIDDPGGAARVREVMASMVAGGEEGRLRGEALRDSWADVRGGLEKLIVPALRSDADYTAAIRQVMDREWAEADRRIRDDVKATHVVDKQRVSEIVRANLLDLVGAIENRLIGPLKLLLQKATGAVEGRLRQTRESLASARDAMNEGNRATLLRHLRDAADRIREQLEADPRGLVIAGSDAWRAAVMSPEEIRKSYDGKQAEFEDWLRAELDGIARTAKIKGSIQLAVFGLIFGVLTVTAMVYTGGAITLLEGILAGPIAMLVNKLLVKAIDWDLVEALHKKARDRFAAIFPAIVDEQIARGRKLTEDLRAGSDAATDIGKDLDDVDMQLGRLVGALMQDEGEEGEE